MTAGRQTAVGAFVLGGAVLILGTVALFGTFRPFSPTLKAVIVFQDSISGLAIGAPVTFRGVRVGAVDAITVQFNPDTQSAFIPVTVQLQPEHISIAKATGSDAVDMPYLVEHGLRAELNTQSFVTGQSEIGLDFDTGSAALLHPGVMALPEIPTRRSTMQRVTEQLSQLPLRELADNAGATLQSLRTLSEKLSHDLPPLVDSLKSTSDRSSQAIESATRTITDLQERVGATLADIGQLAVAGKQQLGLRGAELHTLLGSSNQAVLQAQAMLEDVKGLTSNRSADRANIDSALRDIATAAASLRGFANDVEHNPQLLLTGRRQ